jgi:hypothetical protein
VKKNGGAAFNPGRQDASRPATLPPSDALLTRYRSDGSLDPSFGSGGVLFHDFRDGAAVCGPLVHVE